MNLMIRKLRDMLGNGYKFVVTGCMALLMLSLSQSVYAGNTTAGQHAAKGLHQAAAIKGRPGLAMKTSGNIRGFLSAEQRTDGTIVIYDHLSGVGSIEAEHVIIEGDVSPGNSPGCMNFGGNVTLNTYATLLIEIGGTVVCDDYDSLSVVNELTINGATLQVELINGFLPSVGQRFNILNWGSLTGTFGYVDLTNAPLTGGLFWDTSRLYITGEVIVGSPDDTDSDGIRDYIDNCILVPNPTQCDGDNDGYGNHCDADFNGDLIVNGLDVGPFKVGFGTTDPVTDLNCDGITNGLDVGPFKSMFGTAPGPSGLNP